MQHMNLKPVIPFSNISMENVENQLALAGAIIPHVLQKMPWHLDPVKHFILTYLDHN